MLILYHMSWTNDVPVITTRSTFRPLIHGFRDSITHDCYLRAMVPLDLMSSMPVTKIFTVIPHMTSSFALVMAVLATLEF